MNVSGAGLIALGNRLLRERRLAEAEATYRVALTLEPRSVAARTNLGTALKRQDRLDEALACFREATALLRGFPPRAEARIEPAQMETFRFVAPLKLRHDIEQLEYLMAQGALPPSFRAAVDGYRAVLAELDDGRDPARARALSGAQTARLGPGFNRLVHHAPIDIDGPCLDPALDPAKIEGRYASSSPAVVIVDDLLSKPALEALRRFCLESTIWFDCKEAGGYLGAYLHDGFDAPLLPRLARELRAKLPALLGPHPLVQAWAFKYAPGGGGTRPHADDAAVNINLWLTPDQARREGAPGGLRIHPVAVPDGWGFDDYNRDPARLVTLIEASGAAPVDVAYRCNRAVIFDSRLIHETLPYDFRPAYEDRRLNLTLLYGERPRGT